MNIDWFWTSYSEECNSPSVCGEYKEASESMMISKILTSISNIISISNINIKILSLDIGYVIFWYWLTFDINIWIQNIANIASGPGEYNEPVSQ